MLNAIYRPIESKTRQIAGNAPIFWFHSVDELSKRVASLVICITETCVSLGNSFLIECRVIGRGLSGQLNLAGSIMGALNRKAGHSITLWTLYRSYFDCDSMRSSVRSASDAKWRRQQVAPTTRQVHFVNSRPNAFSDRLGPNSKVVEPFKVHQVAHCVIKLQLNKSIFFKLFPLTLKRNLNGARSEVVSDLPSLSLKFLS